MSHWALPHIMRAAHRKHAQAVTAKTGATMTLMVMSTNICTAFGVAGVPIFRNTRQGSEATMSSRLDQEREARLAPQRIQSTKKKLEELGYYVRAVDHTQLEITLNDGSFVKFWPYSGWHSGKAIEDGRGFDQLLKKLEVANKPRIEYDTREFNGGLDFKPKPYQKEVLDNYHADQNVQLTTGRDGRNRFVGIDHVAKGGDKTVVSQHLKGNHPNMIIFDEASNWPDYKWYRNPIKWLQFRKVMKTLERRHK